MLDRPRLVERQVTLFAQALECFNALEMSSIMGAGETGKPHHPNQSHPSLVEMATAVHELV